jgi:hypothetical protein
LEPTISEGRQRSGECIEMKINQIYKELQNIINSRPLSSVEELSLARDLGIVRARLEKQEYAKGFSSARGFDVQYRVEQAYTELEFLSTISTIWEQIISTLPIKSFHKVIDICPGYTPKIELALCRLGYKKKITIIDQDRRTTRRLLSILRLFHPQFVLSVLNKNVTNVSTNASLVVANHILDDVTLEFYGKRNNIPLDKIYNNETLLINTWKNIVKQKDHIYRNLVPKLTDALNRYVKTNGYLCMTQYPSYMEKLLDLKNSVQFCSELFEHIQVILVKEKFSNITELVKDVKFSRDSHFKKNHVAIMVKQR